MILQTCEVQLWVLQILLVSAHVILKEWNLALESLRVVHLVELCLLLHLLIVEKLLLLLV